MRKSLQTVTSRRSRFWIVGLVLLIGSPTSLLAAQFILHEHLGAADYLYHALVFLAGLAIFDKDAAEEVAQAIRFWRRGNGNGHSSGDLSRGSD